MNWVRTIHALLARPRQSVRTFQIERDHSRTFASVTIAAAALAPPLVFCTAVGLGWFLRGTPAFWIPATPSSPARVDPVAVGSLLLGGWLGLSCLVWLLTRVEYLGIRTFGRVHGKRITRTVARTITAHATAGWLAASLLASAGFLIGAVLHNRALHHNAGDWRGPMMLSVGILPLLGGLAGMLWFEVIVYLGVLNCKFANRARAAEPDTPSASPQQPL